MFGPKTKNVNYIVNEVIYNSIKSIMLNVLINKLLPRALNLFKYLGTNLSSCNIICVYMIVAVVILFILYKIFTFFKFNKKSNKEVPSNTLSSILSKLSDYDLNPKNMEKKKK